MRTVLPIIKAALSQVSTLAKNAVYITPAENFMPTGVKPPCVGLVPGKSPRRELIAEMHERELTISLAAFVPMGGDGEQVLCADDGVYKLLDDCCAQLDPFALAIPGLQGIDIGGDSASSMFQAKNRMFFVKVTRAITLTVER